MDPYAFLGRQAPARSSGSFGPTAQDIVENAPPASPDAPQSLNQAYFRPSDGRMITPHALSKKENMDDAADSVVGGAIEGALSDTFGHWLHVHMP